MNVVAIQHDIVWEDRGGTHARVERLLEGSPPGRGELVVLPEMFASGFSMETGRTSDTARGETMEFLRGVARRYGCSVMAGLVSSYARGKACHFNESVLVGPDGGEVLRYQKIHPFTLGGEAERHEAGERIVTAALGGFTLCPFICYDLRFPEIFRVGVTKGADLFVVIANWPIARVHHWVTLLQARAIENQAYVVGVNRSGRDPSFEYPGRSMIVDPSGVIVADAGKEEGVIRATLDPKVVEQVRTKLPFLKDLRTRYLRTE